MDKLQWLITRSSGEGALSVHQILKGVLNSHRGLKLLAWIILLFRVMGNVMFVALHKRGERITLET